MKARCIKNTEYKDVLTVGKVYEVSGYECGELGLILYKFIGNDNKEHTAYEYRFKIIEKEILLKV